MAFLEDVMDSAGISGYLFMTGMYRFQPSYVGSFPLHPLLREHIFHI